MNQAPAGWDEGVVKVAPPGWDEAAPSAEKKAPARSWKTLPRDVGHGVLVGASGFNEGLANLLGMPVDAINSALSTLGVKTSDMPVAGSKWLKEKVMPAPMKPKTAGEKIIGAIGEQIPPMVMPAVGAEAFLAGKMGQAPRLVEAAKAAGKVALGAGAGSGIAREVWPGSPVADVAAQLAGGIAVGAGPALYQSGKRAFQAAKRGAPTVTEKQLRTRAGQVLNETAGTSSIYDQNAAAATKTEKAIPGFKATIGEKTNDPGLIKLQRGLESGRGKDAAELMAEKKAVNMVAVKDYLANEFKGDESIDDVISALQKKKANTEATIKYMDAEANTAREAMPTAGRQESGRAAVETIEKGRVPLSAQKDVLYAEVGNPPVGTSATKEAAKAMKAEFTPGEESVYPSGVLAKINKVLKPKTAEVPAPGTEIPLADPKVAEKAEKLAKKGLETAFSRFQKSKIKMTPDIEEQLKATQQRNLYKLFTKGAGTPWDKVAQELAGENEIAGFAAGDKMDVTRFVDWLQSNPVLGKSKDVYADKLAKATSRVSAVMSDVGERGFQELHSLRKDIGRQISDAVTGANPNMPLARRLYTLKGAIDSDIEAALGGENAYQVARDFARDYYLKFRSGAVGKVLQKGQQASGRAIPDAEISRRLFTLDGADDFIRAVGKENAATVMSQHAAENLSNSGAVNKLTGEINTKQLSSWYSRNKSVLEKFGISKEFSDVRNAYVNLDEMKAQQIEFGKSVAGKMLNADPQNAIKAAMPGKNTGESMRQLIKEISDINGVPDKTAMLGLKNGFKDFIISEAETTAKTIAGDQVISPANIQKAMKKYDPAMRVLFNDEPRKIEAMLNVQNAIEIQARSAKSPIGGGSDTAEKLAAAQSVMGRLLDHVPGISYAGRLARAGLKAVGNLNELEMNKLLAQAMYDSELAQTLRMAAKNQAPKEVSRRIGNQLLTLGIGVHVNRPKDEEVPNEE